MSRDLIPQANAVRVKVAHAKAARQNELRRLDLRLVLRRPSRDETSYLVFSSTKHTFFVSIWFANFIYNQKLHEIFSEKDIIRGLS
jgi:hypothetical protein